MNMNYNAAEIFAMALEIERRGRRFYERAAEMFDDEHTRDMLQGLAAMEAEHEKTFAAMQDKFTSSEEYAAAFDPDDLAVSYLRSLTEGWVFPREEPELRGNESLDVILTMAVQAEKDSIIFYTGLKRFVPAALGGDLVEKIIAEEMNHIVIINERFRAMNA